LLPFPVNQGSVRDAQNVIMNSPIIDLFLIKGVVVLVVFITFKKDEKKFRQIAMDEKEQEKSELPPLLGTKEVKESGELEKED
jgi:hypothetical protein